MAWKLEFTAIPTYWFGHHGHHMPEMDGIDLFRSMQQGPVLAKIPVLLISGVPTEKFAT